MRKIEDSADTTQYVLMFRKDNTWKPFGGVWVHTEAEAYAKAKTMVQAIRMSMPEYAEATFTLMKMLATTAD